MEEQKMAKLSMERKVNTYWELNNASSVLLNKSHSADQPNEDGIIPGCRYTTMASLIFTAFTFEAYLNHLGDGKIKYWGIIEKKLNVTEKYELLAEECDIKIDKGANQYQILRDLFKFRNYLAHGKSVIIQEKKNVSIDTDIRNEFEKLKTRWEEYCTEANAKLAMEVIESLINELDKSSGGNGNPLFNGHFGKSSLTY